MTEGRTDDRIIDLISAAVLAGAYRSLAREIPEAKRGLLKLAARHSARVVALVGEICAAARLDTGAAARMPDHREW